MRNFHLFSKIDKNDKNLRYCTFKESSQKR
jgi:hypothetical protein